MPENGRLTEQGNQFFTSIIEPYVAPPRFVCRDWLVM
jgi:hypothetical protein